MTIDITQFTRTDDPRPYCRQQIRLRDGRVIATSGVMAIVPDTYDGDASVLLAAPDNVEAAIARMLAPFSLQLSWLPVSSLSIPVLEVCKDCGGSGRVVHVMCGDCDGHGDFQHGRHWHSCKECDGQGDTDKRAADKDDPEAKECWSCRGTGKGGREVFVAIPGMPKGLGADGRLLSRFPADAEYSVPGRLGGPLILRGAGWRGVLMPMRGGC